MTESTKTAEAPVAENAAETTAEVTEKAPVTPKDKIQQLLDRKPSAKQTGFVQWIKDQHGFDIDVDTLRVVQGTYGPLYRKSEEYTEIRDQVAAESEERKSQRSIEALATKTPEEKAKALEAAIAAEKRAAERIAKLEAMLAEANADSDDESDDVTDDDAEF